MCRSSQTAISGQIAIPFAGHAGLFQGFRSLFRRMATRRQLLSLDERLLRDIGIDRSDIAVGRF